MVNKLVTLISLICLLGLDASALVIPQGKFYFDNSLTAYEQVKFVYGHDSRSETYVLSMNRLAGDKWEITIPQRVEDMYRYTFANTTLPDGKIDDNFINVKENISKVRNEYRTATTDKQIIVDGIFTPESGDNWAQGSWKFEATGVGYSMTLPVIFINTENRQEIVSKEDYINATYYVETFSLPGYEPIGAEDEDRKSVV